MHVDGHEKLAEAPSIGDMQPIAITGRRPTLDRIRIEAAEAAAKERRRALLTRAAIAVGAVSAAAIVVALLLAR